MKFKNISIIILNIIFWIIIYFTLKLEKLYYTFKKTSNTQDYTLIPNFKYQRGGV